MEAGTHLHSRSRRDLRLLGAVLACAVIAGLGIGLLVGDLAGRRSAPPPSSIAVTHRNGMDGVATWAPGAKPAPPITTLSDQSGRGFSLSSLRGHSVALVFFDSHCKKQCPLEGRQLAADESSMPAADRPVLVAVSVNLADTRASVARAMRAWGLAGAGRWYWLMGTRPHLASVWRAYHIYVSPKPINGDIQHTEAVYLIDRRGFERSAFLYPFARRFIVHDMRALA